MKKEIQSALASAEAGEQFILGIENKINGWLADREIDERELKEILEIEAAVRAGIEEHLLEFRGNPKAASKIIIKPASALNENFIIPPIPQVLGYVIAPQM